MKLPLRARIAIAISEFMGKSVGGFQLGYSNGSGYSSSVAGNMLRAYANMPWLRAALGKVADGVAAAPWFIEVAVRNSKPVRISAMVNGTPEHRKALKKKLRSKTCKAPIEVVEIHEHLLLDVLANPNPLMQGPALMALTALHLDLVGEAMWWIRYEDVGGVGIPSEFWPVPPSWILERPKTVNGVFKLQPGTNDEFPEEIPISDMIWFRQPDPADPYTKTVGTAGPLRDELESDEYAAKHIKSWFLNRAQPEIIITGTGLDPKEAERAEERFLGKFRGYWKAHRPWFIGQEAKVIELSGKFTDMQLIDLRKWQRDIVLQSVGIPPEILGVLESSNRATIDTAAFIHAKWVLTPRLEIIRSTLQTQVVPMYDDRISLEYSSPVEEDREFALSVRKSFPWAYTLDELREVTGDPPLENGQGQIVMIPASFVPTLVSELDQFESPYTAQNGREIDQDADKMLLGKGMENSSLPS